MENTELNAEQGFTIRWFKVVCDSCGWSWFESEQVKKNPYFYCPKCLSKTKNVDRKPTRVAKKAEILSLKQYFDQIRLDSSKR